MRYQLSYKQFGERSILIEWPALIDEKLLHDVLYFKQKIEKHYRDSTVHITHAYSSILVNYEYLNFKFKAESEVLHSIYLTKSSRTKMTRTLWRIPVCYDQTFGADLQELSQEKKFTIQELIDRHVNVVYTVYFIGFLPGFLYLGGLDKSLFMPRKGTPRMEIEKGAVAIGGEQTGIYPLRSPGGWYIIGNSPVNFFDVSKEQPCFAKPGDKLLFVPVSLKQYHNIKTLVDAGVYQLESEVFRD
ncbi:5-oxoprolinase subunit PxpB [Aestuariivivens sediminis]|uniref:5-oxoprolinase subunit PxpB n=1 Tax=Aestuariivivens sediminis TaxID=2913557 RepID=UPI001F593F10|nr:5-oxoprolinase subunit PxpB [Aestuariivivens sediminis]